MLDLISNGHPEPGRGEHAEEKGSRWTFFLAALAYYWRKGVDAPGQGDFGREYKDWRIGSLETIRERLRQFIEADVDQVSLLNKTGKTSHRATCESIYLFAREVMPEFRARQAA